MLVILNILHLVFTMLAVSTPSLNATLWPALTIPIYVPSLPQIDTPLQGASNVSSFTEPYARARPLSSCNSPIPGSNAPPSNRSVTATLVSRFLIHLQAANRHVVHIDTHSSIGGGGDHGDAGLVTFSSLGTLVFERVVDSMGSTLSYSHAEEEGDDLDDRDAESTELRLAERNRAPDAESGLLKEPETVRHAIECISNRVLSARAVCIRSNDMTDL